MWRTFHRAMTSMVISARTAAVTRNMWQRQPANSCASRSRLVSMRRRRCQGALTASHGIFDHGKLTSGQRILITGASGAVGSMAVQLANVIGAHVIGIGSGRNEEFVRGLGADEFIDYKKAKFEAEVSGVDVVFDTVGGDMQQRAFQTLKRGGFLVSTVDPPSAEKAKEFGVTVAMVVMIPKPDQLAAINQLLESGKLTVRIATVLPLAEVKKAHQLSASGHADGKIILRP